MKAQKLEVLVEPLSYKMDRYQDSLNLNVYIERGFRWGKWGEESYAPGEIEPLKNNSYPYSICFDNHPKKDLYIHLREDQQFKFESGRQYLERPVLRDSIIYELTRSGIVVGEMKVWE